MKWLRCQPLLSSPLLLPALWEDQGLVSTRGVLGLNELCQEGRPCKQWELGKDDKQGHAG